MATVVKSAGNESQVLHSRFAALRRRLWMVISFRGLSWLLATLLAVAVVAGSFDWWLHLPGVIRAFFLVAGLVGCGYVVYRYLLVPLAQKTDDLTLALKIEEHYPGFNDALASAVEFLEEPPDSDLRGSPSMRREAIKRGLRKVQHADFNCIIDKRGTRTAGLSMLLAAVVAGLLIFLQPTSAWTAVMRLALPFGGPEWPGQTELEVEKPRDRIGKDDPFYVRAVVRAGKVNGLIPETARVIFKLDGGAQIEQVVEVKAGEDGVHHLQAELKPGQINRNFSFQVKAHDATSPRFQVKVLPKPMLVPLDGKASPQVRLHYPAYTDLPDSDLPDGSGNIEAVAGTTATLRAAVDRPIVRAWIEYQPENPQTKLGLSLGVIGDRHPLEAAVVAAAPMVLDNVAAQIEDGKQLRVTFSPRFTGMYELYFEDDIGLRGKRVFELHVIPDPSPTVAMERPKSGRDQLEIMSNGQFPVQVSAEDAQYAVRYAWLSYRTKKEDPPRWLPLYDHTSASFGAAALMTALTRSPLVRTPQVPFKLGRVSTNKRMPLALFRHLDGSALKEGDVLTIQAFADDFDDVSVDKAPGKSEEVEIRIISRNALEVLLNQKQAEVQQELVRLREKEREAEKKVAEVEAALRKEGKLNQDEIAKLLEAEQLQEQIRERVGNNKEEGLRGEVERIMETLRNNQVPRSATQERMEAVQRELERLARQELEQIEPRLTDVRKQNEAAERKPEAAKKDQKELQEARMRQEEVEKTLTDLLSRLEPWASTREIKGEMRSILEEQRRLAQETKQANDKGLMGKEKDRLTPPERQELDRLQDAQRKLEERTERLLDQMGKVAEERREKDPQTAEELQRAQEMGRDSQVKEDMRQAKEAISQNQLGNAKEKQEAATRKLEDLVREMEDKREAELDRLVKKLKEAQKKIDELTEKQETLQKKAKELQEKLQNADTPEEKKKIEDELKRLGKEQEKLQQEAQEMVKRLSRLRAERASQAMNKAEEALKQAGEQLNRGQNNQEQQDEVLDRLDEAARELERAQKEAEDELAREQLGKIADQLKRIKDRQEAHINERKRLETLAQQTKRWTNAPMQSLGGLSRAQKGLGEETDTVANEKLSEARVFKTILKKAAKAMEDAGDRLVERRDALKMMPDDVAPDEEVAKLQGEALRRLNQLLEAIKEEQERGPGRAGGGGGGGGEGGEGGEGGGGGGENDGIPPLAQLKLLRALQAEVKQRTEDFGRKHPDPKKLTDAEKEVLKALERDQKEVADLLQELTNPGEGEGDKP